MWAVQKREKVVSRQWLETARQIGAAKDDPGADDLIRKARSSIERAPNGPTLHGDQNNPPKQSHPAR
jgi:hypothetical protein